MVVVFSLRKEFSRRMTTQRSSFEYLTCFALSKFSFYLIIYQFNALFDLPFCCLFQPSIFCPNCFFFKIKESFCLASWLECSVELCLQQVGASLHFKQAVKWNRARLSCSRTSFNSFFWSFSIPLSSSIISNSWSIDGYRANLTLLLFLPGALQGQLGWKLQGKTFFLAFMGKQLFQITRWQVKEKGSCYVTQKFSHYP